MNSTAALKPKARIKRRSGVAVATREQVEADPLYLQNVFAANVRLVRMHLGISQEELADRASVDRTYVSSIERRLRNVSIQNIQRVARALEIDPRDLLDPALSEQVQFHP